MATSSDDEEERGVFAPGIFKGKVVFCTGGQSSSERVELGVASEG